MNLIRDFVVTTPKSEMKTAAREAEQCLRDGGGYYFRAFRGRPLGLDRESKIFYVEDGLVRGFAVVDSMQTTPLGCELTGRSWPGSIFAIMRADSWTWIHPIRMQGFQGYRRYSLPYKVIGGWRDPKPFAGGAA